MARKLYERKIWQESQFVFDTSFLSNLYRYSNIGQYEIFEKVFKPLENRLYITGTVWEEFNEGRLGPIKGSKNSYSELLKHIQNIESNIKQIENKTKVKALHPKIDESKVVGISKLIDSPIKALKDEISQQIKNLDDTEYNDEVKNFIESLFTITPALDFKNKLSLISEGETRYRNQIPPGYMDEKKSGIDKFNDLYIWKEIINLGLKEKRSILFITDDTKGDWWELDKSHQPIEPRKELYKEFEAITGEFFHMYTSREFIEKTGSVLNYYMRSDTYDEIKKVEFLAGDESQPTISSYTGSDDDNWRVQRIKTAIDTPYLADTLNRIKSLHDHKGTLEVEWKYPPTKFHKFAIERVWREAGEYTVDHLN